MDDEYQRGTDWGCLYILLAPLAVAAIGAGFGDWVIATIVGVLVAVVVVVTVGEMWTGHRKRP